MTPVKSDILIKMLRDSGYPEDKTDYLEDGFKDGFDIGYEGPEIRQSEAENIPLKIGTKTELWNKLMKEVNLKRVAGPFSREDLPFQNYIQSPIGLVPKAGNSGKTRLIFHLSYDFKRKQPIKSLNHFTPKNKCTVKYRDIDYTVSVYLKLAAKVEQSADGESSQTWEHFSYKFDKKGGITIIFGGKTDVQSAFRLIPLKRKCWKWLLMKAQDPLTREWKFFIDKCLPFWCEYQLCDISKLL